MTSEHLSSAHFDELKNDRPGGTCSVPLFSCHLFPHSDSNFVLGNAQVQSLYPIVYCSDGFCELTGFARGELMQKSCMCHFLYGSETSECLTSLMQIALDERREYKTEIILYKKSGTFRLIMSNTRQCRNI